MVKKVILILLGLLSLIIGIPLALGGGGILAVGGRDGNVHSGFHSVSTPTTAFVTDATNFANSGIQPRNAKVSIVVESRGSTKPVFIGVARAQDVENYLRSSAKDEITKITFNPFDLQTVRSSGSLAPIAAPGTQTFWVAQSSGSAPAMTWEVISDSNYRAVVMNADGSAGLNTELSMGVKAPLVFGIGLGMLIAGLVLTLLGLALVIWGIAAKRKKAGPNSGVPVYDSGPATQPVAAAQPLYGAGTQPGYPAGSGNQPPYGGGAGGPNAVPPAAGTPPLAQPGDVPPAPPINPV